MGQSIWAALAAGALAFFVAQIIVNIIYAAGDEAWATDPHTKRVLQLFGLAKGHGAKHVILVSKQHQT